MSTQKKKKSGKRNLEPSEIQETEKSKEKERQKLACRWGMTILSKSCLPLFYFHFLATQFWEIKF